MSLDVPGAVCAEAAPAAPATATTSADRHTNGRRMVISLRAGLVSVVVADDRSGGKAWRDERLAQGSRYVRARRRRRDAAAAIRFRSRVIASECIGTEALDALHGLAAPALRGYAAPGGKQIWQR